MSAQQRLAAAPTAGRASAAPPSGPTGSGRGAERAQAARRRRGGVAVIIFYVAVAIFLINLIGLVGTVVVDSFGDEWFNTWLPTGGYSGEWYDFIGKVHDV